MGEQSCTAFGSEVVLAYTTGDYETVGELLRRHVRDRPEDLAACFSVLYTCERVSSAVLDESDVRLGYYAERWRRIPLPRGILLRILGPPRTVRCKWCGRWLLRRDGSCRDCGSNYPEPSWAWDQPWGMAYCEGRGSWGSKGNLPSRLWHEMCDRYESETGETLA